MDVENESGLVTKPSKSFVEALAKRKYEKAIALIKSSQLNVNKICSYDVYRLKPLSLVIKCFYRKDLVQAIIDAGADVNATGWYYIKDRDGRLTTGQQFVTPLYQAVIEESNKDLVLLLIQAGADVNYEEIMDPEIKAKMILQPLVHCAIDKTAVDFDILSLLVENKICLNKPNKKGLDAFQYAASRGKLEIMRLFIEHGYSWRYNCRENKCPLTLFCLYIHGLDNIYVSRPQRTSYRDMAQLILLAGYNVFIDTCFKQFMEKYETVTNSHSLQMIFEVVQMWINSFKRLQFWCRLTIKNAVSGYLDTNAMESLELPTSLANYVSFQDELLPHKNETYKG